MTDKMEFWNKLNRPPKEALKTIRGGRLKGMTDINPQWRYQALTEVFGPCGRGWSYDIKKLWMEQGTDNQVMACALIELYIDGSGHSIPGIGGSMFVVQERGGMHNNDEAYKMAVTDALSTACKMLGVAADIYAGLWDGTKYRETASEDAEAPPKKRGRPPKKKAPDDVEMITDAQREAINKMMDAEGLSVEDKVDLFNWNKGAMKATNKWAADFISNFGVILTGWQESK